MTNELLALCDYQIDDDKRTLNMRKDFPRLSPLGHCELIIPLQESLTANLPPSSSSQSTHQPFPANLPMFHGETPNLESRYSVADNKWLVEFFDEIDVMRSLARPRKISIRGTDGQTYTFLGKPKDDLRKDARLMEFNSIINKLLKANSESRRRQLRESPIHSTRCLLKPFWCNFVDIRTYGVVTLNEECGFIQWVPNTIPIRPVLTNIYDSKRIRSWVSLSTFEENEAFWDTSITVCGNERRVQENQRKWWCHRCRTFRQKYPAQVRLPLVISFGSVSWWA